MNADETQRSKGADRNGGQAVDRRERLAAALRENLKKRKQQARRRKEDREASEEPGPDGA
jgi:hypothetical protein